MLAKTHVVFADVVAVGVWRIACAVGGVSNLNTETSSVTSNLNSIFQILSSEALRLLGLDSMGIEMSAWSDEFWIFVAGASLGALAPDIDEPSSFIGRRTGFISATIKLLFGHRGATHFFIIPFFILLTTFAFADGVLFISLLGFVLGYALHIVGDAMTISGVKNAFFPISEKNFFILPFAFRFRTGGEVEKFVILPICSAILAFELVI